MSDSKPAIQFSSSHAPVQRMEQQLDLVDRLLAEGELAQALVPANITNSLGMQMLWCPPRVFLMGSPEDEEERGENENQVQVQISKGFWMARTTVTQGQWEAMMDSNPSCYKGPNRPVESVSWQDALEFCKKLNDVEQLPSSYHYALPTEAQWEHACRAGENGPYWGGSLDEVGWYRGVSWYGYNSAGGTNPVCQKKPNAWGLHDMHGNVYEWCADWYDDTLLGGTDPKGPSSGVYRVARGGSWFISASRCRAAFRYGIYPGYRDDGLGFRPALVPS